MDELSCLHAYVVFDSVKSKIECLEFYQKFPRVLRCCRKPPEKFRYDGVHCIAVAEPTEPSDIKWENVDVSFWERLWRGLVVYALIIVLMIVAFCVLYGIKNYQDTMPSSEECRDVDTASYSATSLPPTSSDLVVNCFCQRQTYSDLINDSTLNDFCSDYIRTATIAAFLTFLVSLFVATVNVFLRLTMKGLSRFARYENVTLEARSVLTKIAFVVMINSGLLILIANANF